MHVVIQNCFRAPLGYFCLHHWNVFFKQELSVLVVGCLPLDLDEAGLKNILSKSGGIWRRGSAVQREEVIVLVFLSLYLSCLFDFQQCNSLLSKQNSLVNAANQADVNRSNIHKSHSCKTFSIILGY